MLENAVLLVFPALMAYAAASDLLTMTIPNWISIALVSAFLVMSCILGVGWYDVLVGHLSCGAVVLALGFVCFAAGWIGGGDAKVAAAIAIWMGWNGLTDFGVDASLLGGLLTLAILALRRQALPAFLSRSHWISRLHDPDCGVPYGIALAAAGLFLYPQSSLWMSSL